MSSRGSLNRRRQRRARRPRYCAECLAMLSSRTRGKYCLPCRQAAVQRLAGYP